MIYNFYGDVNNIEAIEDKVIAKSKFLWHFTLNDFQRKHESLLAFRGNF